MKLPFKKFLPYSYLIGLFVLAFLIRIYLFSRKKEDATALDIYNILQIGITILLGLILFARSDTYFIIRILLRSPLRWLLFLYFLGIVSGIWSSLPLFSPYFGFEGLIFIIAFSVILYWQADNFAMEHFAIQISYLFILLMVIGLVKLNGFSISWFHWHANNYTAVAAMLFGYCFGEYNNNHREKTEKENKHLKRGIWISLFFVALGTSSASNISLLAGLLTVVLITGRRIFKIISFILFIALFVINQLYGDWIFSIIFPGKELHDVGMLHGRINLWERYFDLIRQKPWAGWGFASLSRISGQYNIHTHNSIIEIVGGVGFIGLYFFILYIFSFYKKILTNLKTPYIVGVAGAVTAGFVNSNSISFIGAPSSALFFAFIIWNLLGLYILKGSNKKSISENENILDNP
jgi:O-antigen ligase